MNCTQDNEMLKALKEIAARGPVEGYSSAGALLLRLTATQAIARAAIAKASDRLADEALAAGQMELPL